MSKPRSIETLRSRIATLLTEREALTTQRKSRAEVAAQVDQTVTRWAAVGATTIQTDLQRLAVGQPADLLTARGLVLNLGPLLTAMLGADHVKNAILATLGAVPESLDTTARLARIKEISAELDDLETIEEKMIVESDGSIQRRANCRPEIILGC